MNKEKFEHSLHHYLVHCSSSGWVEAELYKFNFANWLNRKVQLRVQKPDKVLELCKQSQQLDYTPEGYGAWLKGVQFLWKSGRETLKEFIKLEDIQAMQKLAAGAPLDEGLFSRRGMSYTALSGWLGTLLPDQFIPVPSVDFYHTISWLFDLTDFPQSGYHYFLQSQQYFKRTKQELKKYEAEIQPLFLPHIEQWIRQHYPSRNKPRFEEFDWNWVTEDYHLYLFRVHLDLYQPGGKKGKGLPARTNPTPPPVVKPEITVPNPVPAPEPLELYIPKLLPPQEDLHTSTAPYANFMLTEQDYLEQHRSQMEIGAIAEQVVLEDEVTFLKRQGKEQLSRQVKSVSADPRLGYDILSFEPDGREKKIEVKAIGSGAAKTFFISANELEKSRLLSNYYLYCVEMSGQGAKRIIRLAQPDLLNQDLFRMECITYKVTFN